MKKFMVILMVMTIPVILGMSLFNGNKTENSASSMLISPTPTPESLSFEDYWNIIVDWHKLDLTCFVPCWHDYQVKETNFETIYQDIQDVYFLSSPDSILYDEKLDITAPNNYIYSGYPNIKWAIFSDDSQPLPQLELYGLFFPIYRTTNSGEYYTPLDVRESLAPASVLSVEDYQPSHIYVAYRETTIEFMVIFAFDDLGVAYQYYGYVFPNDNAREAICTDIEFFGVTVWVYDDEGEETILELLNRKLVENDLSRLYLTSVLVKNDKLIEKL